MTRKPKRKRKTIPGPRKPRKAAGPAAKRKPTIKTAKPDASDALIAASAQALGLTLAPGWRGAIRFNLQLILNHAARVAEFALPDDAEPAPVFRA